MSDSERVLLKLNVGAQRLTPGINASLPEDLTKSDLSAMLGMGSLPKPSYWFAMAYYCSDQAALSNLEVWFWHHISDVAYKEGWVVVPGVIMSLRQIQFLCEIALSEIFSPRYCSVCKSLGYIKTDKDICSKCEGSGVIKMPERDCATRLRISRRQWRQVWQGRLSRLRSELNSIVDSLVVHVERYKGN